MRLLFCCEFYYPSVGGVQEVMRQIAERLVKLGHDVTVATSKLQNRKSLEHHGVKIVEFGVSGNLVRGIEGEVEKYQDFVKNFACDALLIKAAQQWTFDALWPLLDLIHARKVFIPCGFSGLLEPSYQAYFEALPQVLRQFDHLIFYAQHYRDVDFARQCHITNFTIVPNGASETEFEVPADPEFRQRHGIPADSAVLLTVGSITGVKGHKELLEAFVRLKTSRRHVTFIMNGNLPPKPDVVVPKSPTSADANLQPAQNNPIDSLPSSTLHPGIMTRMQYVFQNEGMTGIKLRLSNRWRHQQQRVCRILNLKRYQCKLLYLWHGTRSVWRTEGLLGLRIRCIQRLTPRLERYGLLDKMPSSFKLLQNPIQFWIAEAQKDPQHKRLIVADFSRDELVQAYMSADLFVFASNIEYSPLVLFESAAAGTPFLTVPVGNAEEITEWTGAGLICPANKDERGYTRVDPRVLAQEIASAIEHPKRLSELGQAGRSAWQARYTWEKITRQYETILQGTTLP